MKKNLWMLLMGLLLLPMTAVLTSCGDDDDDQGPTADNPLVGSWTGYYIDDMDEDNVFESELDKNDVVVLTFTSDMRVSGREVYVDEEESYDEAFTGTYEVNAAAKEYRMTITYVNDPDQDKYSTGWSRFEIKGNQMYANFDGSNYLFTRK